MDTVYIEKLFLKYVQINSRSQAGVETTPTTPGQTILAQIIVEDLQRLGLEDVKLNSKNGYVTAKLPANFQSEIAPIGFIAHLDTADYEAENIQPLVHENYDGADLNLPGALLRVNEFPELKQLKGKRLITSDGTTLLGTDDKAGIAEIIGAIKHLIDHPELKHGEVKIGFGPDEEIGKGAKQFDAEDFATQFAYTLDNGRPGDLEFETFNGAKAVISIDGTAVHPGNAYQTLVNAILIANQIIGSLPINDVPEKSKDREGFFLVNDVKGSIDHAEIQLIIRDFDDELFVKRQDFLKKIVDCINADLDYPRVNLEITEQYRNIGSAIKKMPEIIDLPLKVYRKLGLKPNITPFRGGTDGNFITAKGIPTPNLFNGGGNYHGPYEYVTTEDLELAAQVVVEIVLEHAGLNN